jgi:TolB-like protein/DNA-binding winged helix-turn-helix (wHTH) protein/Tfp pilus assembly protein PilF
MDPKPPAAKTAPSSGRLAIADLVVDLDRMAVTRAGESVPLPGLSYDLLLALARAAPRVMTHDELMDEVWRGVVVSPETVSQRVKLLRDALGDDARDPRYVAVVRGRGYRLVAAVEAAPNAPSETPAAHAERTAAVPAVPAPSASSPPGPVAEPAAPNPSPEPTSVDVPVHAPDGRPRRGRWIGAALIGVLLVAGAALTLLRPSWLPTPARSTSVAVSGEPARKVAVLPFRTLSADPGDAYVGLGVAETVLNRLASSSSLFVLARSSSFAFDKPDVDARDVGRKLGVRYLVQGGVQRAGDRLRVTAALVDVESGRLVKSLALDRPMAELFALQDQVAAEVASALDASLAPAPKAPANLDANLAYLRGLAALGRWRVGDATAAIEHFHRAQELDPTFAPAFVGEATARIRAATLRGEHDNWKEPGVRELIDRAIALDPNLAAAYVARGELRTNDEDAERDLRHALELAPNDAAALAALGELIGAPSPRAGEALALLDRAIALDPLQPRYRYVRALFSWMQDSDPEAFERRLLDVLSVDPEFPQALGRLAQLVGAVRGRYAEAIQLAERALAADPQSVTARGYLMDFYLAVGDGAAAVAVARAGEQKPPPAIAFAAAIVRSDLGEAEAIAAPAGNPAAGSAFWGPPASLMPAASWTIARDRVAGPRTDRPQMRDALQKLRDAICVYDDCERGVLPVMIELEIARLDLTTGHAERARASAARVLAQLDDPKHAIPWRNARPLVAAMADAVLDRRDDALRALEQSLASNPFPVAWILLEYWPGFDALRPDPRYRSSLEFSRRYRAEQRRALEALRTAGKVPLRG